ncbi:MAG: ribosome biogenesis GTPase Der [Planctomycetia bacterium]|nr:ribosome biogenesis GTPase Der [Planctomycetia bacterium]
MGVPQVVIVGRPNVGKSSLFNWLVHKRIAIVDDRAGVTRDRITFLLQENDRYFEMVDTGGMGIDDEDNLTEHIESQIEAAIDSAAVILFVVDTRDGLTPLDQEVARRLRTATAPVILVANKTDAMTLENLTGEFHELHYQPVVPTSVHQNRGREELLEAIVALLPADTGEAPPADATMKIAIVGRRNVGKSTFVNTLAQAERMIVSEVPGTTRDSVDVRFELDGKPFIAIDTPGLKRGKAIANDMEYYSFHRAQRSIRRADVVLIFYDCADPISKVDKQLADYVSENYKPCVFVVNKWDLYAGKVTTDEWVTYLHDTFRSMKYVPIAFITGQTGKNMKALLNHSQMLFKQSTGRIGTGELNRLLRWALAKNAPAVYQNRRPKIFYATQVGIQPPTIVLFCSEPAAITADYKRYLLTAFRDHLPFSEVPIKLYLRASHGDPKRDAARGGRAAERPDIGVQEKEAGTPFDDEEDGFDEKDLMEADAASRGEAGTFDAEWTGLDADEE